MKVVIDGRFVLDEPDLHRRMAGAFGYGPRHARTLPALRERLSAGDPRPVELVWIHTEAIRMALGEPAYTAVVAALEQVAAADEGRHWAQRFVFRLF